MNDWLNRLCDVRRLGTFQAAKRWHDRGARTIDTITPRPGNSAMGEALTKAAEKAVSRGTQAEPLPLWATKYILDHGTAAYRKLMADTVALDDRLREGS